MSQELELGGAVDAQEFKASLLKSMPPGSEVQIDSFELKVIAKTVFEALPPGFGEIGANITQAQVDFRMGIANSSGAPIADVVLTGISKARRLLLAADADESSPSEVTANGKVMNVTLRRSLKTGKVAILFQVTTSDQNAASAVASALSNTTQFLKQLVAAVKANGKTLTLDMSKMSQPAPSLSTTMTYTIVVQSSNMTNSSLGVKEIANEITKILNDPKAMTAVANQAAVPGTAEIATVKLSKAIVKVADKPPEPEPEPYQPEPEPPGSRVSISQGDIILEDKANVGLSLALGGLIGAIIIGAGVVLVLLKQNSHEQTVMVTQKNKVANDDGTGNSVPEIPHLIPGADATQFTPAAGEYVIENTGEGLLPVEGPGPDGVLPPLRSLSLHRSPVSASAQADAQSQSRGMMGP